MLIKMGKKYIILVRVIIAIALLSPVHTESDEENNKDAETDISGVLESKNSKELSTEEKSADELHEATEIRVERSPEALSDEKIDTVEVKSGINKNSRKSMSDQKSGETFRNDKDMSRSNFEKDTDDLDTERSETNIEEKTASEDKLSNKKDDDDNEDLDEKDGKAEMESSRSVPHESQDELLDSKVRTAQDSAEEVASLENKAGFDLTSNNAANVLGNRRSMSSDSTRHFEPAALERSGDIFNKPSLQIPERPSIQFNKIPTQETFLPYQIIRPPPRPLLNQYRPNKVPQKSNDPISSAESKPLDEFNLNPFANTYPFAYNAKPSPIPTTSTSTEVKKPADLLSQFPQTLQIYPPRVKFLGDNVRPFFPVTFKPAPPNLPLPPYNIYLPKYNRLPSPPYFYPRKCSVCS